MLSLVSYKKDMVSLVSYKKCVRSYLIRKTWYLKDITLCELIQVVLEISKKKRNPKTRKYIVLYEK